MRLGLGKALGRMGLGELHSLSSEYSVMRSPAS